MVFSVYVTTNQMFFLNFIFPRKLGEKAAASRSALWGEKLTGEFPNTLGNGRKQVFPVCCGQKIGRLVLSNDTKHSISQTPTPCSIIQLVALTRRRQFDLRSKFLFRELDHVFHV